jgi:hypothetical protein
VEASSRPALGCLLGIADSPNGHGVSHGYDSPRYLGRGMGIYDRDYWRQTAHVRRGATRQAQPVTVQFRRLWLWWLVAIAAVFGLVKWVNSTPGVPFPETGDVHWYVGLGLVQHGQS